MTRAPFTGGPVPPRFGISLVDQARTIAMETQCHMVIVEGIMSGDIALPEILRDYQGDLQLKLHSNTTHPISAGVYKLCNQSRLDEIVSILEDNEGFKLVVIDPQGDEIPAYTL